MLCLYVSLPVDPRDPHSFPTRRSSDLQQGVYHSRLAIENGPTCLEMAVDAARFCALAAEANPSEPQWRDAAMSYLYRAMKDRKSTRLNSSHLGISYAVFCLKKKKTLNH